MTTLEELVTRWHAQSETLRTYGAPGPADAVRRCADELARALASQGSELLTLTAAARESGYSADHLSRLVRAGRLQNHGREHAPKVRRAELPRKPVKPSRLASGLKGQNMEALTREAIASTRGRSA